MSRFVGLEHVQLDIPPGGEAVARAFYASVLGLHEIAKPGSLSQTGVWFTVGTGEIHLGAVADARPAVKGHAAIRVVGLGGVAKRCEESGHAVEHDHRYPGRERFYVRDPFGNRLELFELDDDASKPPRGPQPTIETARLILRPFVAADAPEVQRLAGDARVAETTLNIPHPYPDGLAESWIAAHASRWDEGVLATFAVVERSTNELVGACGLVIEPRHAKAELGYWIAVSHWSRGFATEAGRAIIDFAFDVLKLNRVQARHYPRNPASGRVMQKLGMTFEGIHRESLRKHDVSEDSAMYAILAADPRPPR